MSIASETSGRSSLNDAAPLAAGYGSPRAPIAGVKKLGERIASLKSAAQGAKPVEDVAAHPRPKVSVSAAVR
jgi:hypothetical protein